jgi:hypothetical protein
MNKMYFTFALAVMCIVSLGTTSRAQDTDGIIVNVPFEFVVGAKVMPAGTYMVARLFSDPSSGVVLRSAANSAVVLPTTVEGASVFKALLTFQHMGETYFLGKIETPGMVYTFSTPRPRMTLARTHDDETTVRVGGTN